MTHAMYFLVDHHRVMMPTAVPRARASHLLVGAAPILLWRGPAMVPIGEASIAIICVHHMDHLLPVSRTTRVEMGTAPRLLGMRPQTVPVAKTILTIVGLINHGVPMGVIVSHHMWWRRHWNFHIVIRTLDMHWIWLLDVDHLWWLFDRNRDLVMHHDRFYHRRTRYMDFHIARWAWHMVGVVNGVHDWSMRWHGLWHWNFHMLYLGHGVIVVFVHHCFGAIHLVLVAAPTCVLRRPRGIRMGSLSTAVVVLGRCHDLHVVDDRWLLRHLDMDVVILRHLPVDGVVVTTHHLVHLWWSSCGAL